LSSRFDRVTAALRVSSAAFTSAALRPSSARVRVGGACLAFAVCVSAIYLGYRSCGDCVLHQYDDAYITFRYAHNLASGRGLVFNPGDATDSASSFSYTIMIALLEKLGSRDHPLNALIIGLACAGGVAATVYLACLARTRRLFLSLFLACTCAANGLVSGWAVSGMETLLYTLLVTSTAYRSFVRGRLGWLEALLVLACLLTRFEAVLLAGAWFVLAVARYRRAEPRERRTISACVLAVGAGFAAFLALKYALYGTVIPHAFALKTITSLYAPNPGALWDVWHRYCSGVLLFAIVGLVALLQRSEGRAFALFCAASALSLLVGPFADWARYSTHMLPIAAIVASAPLSRALRRVPLLAIVGCGFIGWQTLTSFDAHRSDVALGANHARCRAQIGRALERELAPGTVVLSSDIGVIAYYAPSITFVDAVGLTSKDVLLPRMRGEAADEALYRMRPQVVADSCREHCASPNEFSALDWLTAPSFWRTELPRSRYVADMRGGHQLAFCRTPDRLTVGAARFELRARR
jgi:hypothetical protein